jgi:hypothetical protein
MEDHHMDEMSDMDFMDTASAQEARPLGWIAWLTAGAALGLAAMYLLDPAQGRRRRTRLVAGSNRLYKAVRGRFQETPFSQTVGREVTSRGEYLQSH